MKIKIFLIVFFLEMLILILSNYFEWLVIPSYVIASLLALSVIYVTVIAFKNMFND